MGIEIRNFYTHYYIRRKKTMYLSQLEYILLSKMSEKIISNIDDSEIITEKEI